MFLKGLLKKDLPLVSIIIPTYNSSVTLIRCLHSVIKQDYPNKEIIVVDDGSTDNTAECVVAYPVQLIRHKKNKGPAIARNTGIKHAKGKILVFIDADCVAKNDWLITLVSNFENEETSCVAGRTVLRNFMRPKWLTENLLPFFSLFDLGEISKEIKLAITANFGVRKEIFDEIGFFYQIQTKILYNEDFEFCKRLSQTGHKIIYEPNATVLHEVNRKRISIIWLIRRAYLQGIADFWYKMINLNLSGITINIIRPFLKLLFYIELFYLIKVIWGLGYLYGYVKFNKAFI